MMLTPEQLAEGRRRYEEAHGVYDRMRAPWGEWLDHHGSALLDMAEDGYRFRRINTAEVVADGPKGLDALIASEQEAHANAIRCSAERDAAIARAEKAEADLEVIASTDLEVEKGLRARITELEGLLREASYVIGEYAPGFTILRDHIDAALGKEARDADT